jgi:hypothetical protein
MRVSDLKITNVPDEIINDITIYTNNKGIPRSRFLKEKLKEIRDAIPKEDRIPNPNLKG